MDLPATSKSPTRTAFREKSEIRQHVVIEICDVINLSFAKICYLIVYMIIII